MFCVPPTEINKIQSGENPMGSPKHGLDESTKNGNSNESEGSMAGAKSPVEGPVRREQRPYKKPVDPFDSKLYQPIRLTEKVFIPAKDFPKVGGFEQFFPTVCLDFCHWFLPSSINLVCFCFFVRFLFLFSSGQFNFVGKLLGPRGHTFKRLQQSTGTKMSILGKGSMRDKEKVNEALSRTQPELLLWTTCTSVLCLAETFYPFHSQEWSSINSSCSLTCNITSQSMKNLAFHSLLRWKMIVLQNSHCITSYISL